MIGTPTLDYKVDVRWVDSLMNTLRALNGQVVIVPVFMPGEALLQKARNELVQLAVEGEVDDLVFIDSDMVWQPLDFAKLLSHEVDMIGGLCPQKTETRTICVRMKKDAKMDEKTGLLEVDSVGTGFLRISRKALLALWNSAREYSVGTQKCRMVFEVMVERGELVSEDLAMCNKWKRMRGKVYVDANVQIAHIGTKVYTLLGGAADAKEKAN